MLREAVQQVAHMYQAYMHHVCFVISVVRYLFILYVTPILSSHHGLDVFRLNQLRLACAVGFVKKKKRKLPKHDVLETSVHSVDGIIAT